MINNNSNKDLFSTFSLTRASFGLTAFQALYAARAKVKPVRDMGYQ